MSHKNCKCADFLQGKFRDGEKCRFAKHPDPALCDREARRPEKTPVFGELDAWAKALEDLGVM